MRILKACALLAVLAAALLAAAQTQYSVLYSFGANGPNDGSDSKGKLVRDSQGNLYGTTTLGGSAASGTVYELAPSGSGWTETVLYNFCSQDVCPDGAFPWAGLVLDQAGNLYGSTVSGGLYGWGTVFELSPPSGPATPWSETVLWS
ncbi:MAG: choice-of-anchor tandem repeat GloVer-containing protein, partial [Terriglobales bacterium]